MRRVTVGCCGRKLKTVRVAGMNKVYRHPEFPNIGIWARPVMTFLPETMKVGRACTGSPGVEFEEFFETSVLLSLIGRSLFSWGWGEGSKGGEVREEKVYRCFEIVTVEICVNPPLTFLLNLN